MYSALAMPSPMTPSACNGGNRIAEAIAVTTPTAADAGSSRRGSRPVEAAQPDGARSAYLAVKHSGDEESRDDEEHVDAGEPTAHTGHAGMKEHDGQHRDGTQAFEVLAKCRLRRTQAPRLRDGADALNVCHRHQPGEAQLSRMVDTCEIATGAAMSIFAPITV